jgi:predicted ATP-binding protein involved in virulence
MIIRALTIENFKVIREPVRVEFKPITLLFGPNSAGKSTIVQALHYAREILERNNLDVDRTIGTDESFDLGGFRNLVHKHDLNLPIRLKFELSFSPLADLSDFFTGKVDNAWIEFEVKWSNFLSAPLVISCAIGLDGEDFARIVCAEDGKRARITDINFIHHLLAISEVELQGKNEHIPYLLTVLMAWIKEEFITGDNEQLFINQQSALPQYVQINSELMDEEKEKEDREEREADLEKYYEEPREWEVLNDFFQTYFGGLTSVLRDELKKFRYIGPIRKTPPRFFTPIRAEDESRWTSGLAAWDVLNKADDSFIQKTNSWLANENRLNSGYRLEVKKYKELDTSSSIWLSLTSKELLFDDEEALEDIRRLPEKKRIFLHDETNGIEVLPQDVGIGISQVLPVIVVALHSNSGIVAIEQPELHIHPAFQVALGDLFISQVKEQQDVCFLLETHSEHLLLRLLRRIRETHENSLSVDAPSLKPDLISIFYIEQSEKGMLITPLQVDETGEFTNRWPKGFFEERDEELF